MHVDTARLAATLASASIRRASDIALALLSGACALLAIFDGLERTAGSRAALDFPMAIGGVLAIVALALVVRGLLSNNAPARLWRWPELLIVMLAIVAARLALDFWAEDWMMGFGPSEFAALTLLWLSLGFYLARLSRLRALAMILLGLLLGTVGLDLVTGIPRLTFGREELLDGLNFIEIGVGLLILADGAVALAAPAAYWTIYMRRIDAGAPRLSTLTDVATRVIGALAIIAAVYVAYEFNRQLLDVAILVAFGILGVAAKFLGWNRAVLCLAFFHAGLEEQIHRILLLTRGEATLVLSRPITATFVMLSLLLLGAGALLSWRDRTPLSRGGFR